MESNLQEQIYELEALQAIYDSDFIGISNQPPCFMILLHGEELKVNVTIQVIFPANYPAVAPKVEIPMRSGQLSQLQKRDLLNHLAHVAEENRGMAMVYTLMESAKEWIVKHGVGDANESFINKLEEQAEENRGMAMVYTLMESAKEWIVKHGVGDANESFINKLEEQPSSTQNVAISIPEPTTTGGRWDFVIGLVGKPSAGKSTFFNAATTLNTAKMGAHPFTTIEPNIGKAYYTIPCPCQKLDIQCDAAHGHNAKGERFMPVLLKDVAGLIPGACEGKGRGNKFLNDLLDADVLVHIIDSSGCTNDKGEETTDYDPSLDVIWLQQEIQQWIFDNIKDKWENIKKKPAKLLEMFTGYHASKAVIHSAFHIAGIDEKKLSELPMWSDEVLHSLVGHFLQIRFPIFLVLNKCDTPTSADNISKIEEKFPDIPRLPVSATTECQLQALHKLGCISYDYGGNDIGISQTLSTLQVEQVRQAKELLKHYKSTNVQQALCNAVKLRKPTYAFPVQCLNTLTSIDKYRGVKPGRLCDCVTLKPNTTVENLYNIMLHYPLKLTAGDFVRAECIDNLGDTTKIRIMKKDERIVDGNNILRICTTRKVSLVKSKE